MEGAEVYMSRAIQLSKLGLGHVSPNPLVGCVIVNENRIIGEGYHEQYGQAHAEVNAVRNVKEKHLIEGASAFVTLEPCSHFGKTPPCADMLIDRKLKEVYVATLDPNPVVSGKGISKMRKAGINVHLGLLEAESRAANERFLTYHQADRPFVILKWAETQDGFIARENFDSKWISNQRSRQLVHQWRAEEDAILVGKNTALYDNPKLNVRHWSGANPIRVAIDLNLELPANHHLLDQSTETYIFNRKKAAGSGKLHWEKIDDSKDLLPQLITKLHQLRIQSVIIEGGAKTLQLFIDANYWDEARVFKAPNNFGSGIKAPQIHGNLTSEIDVEGDTLSILKNPLAHGR